MEKVAARPDRRADLDDFDLTATLEKPMLACLQRRRCRRLSDAATLILAYFALVAELSRWTMGGGPGDSSATSRSQSRRVSGLCRSPSRSSTTWAFDIRPRPRGIEAFNDYYTWLRIAAFLYPRVAADVYGELKSTFYCYKNDYPLTGRLLDRIYALSGNDAAAAEGNRFWHHCLATLREEAEYVSQAEAFFGAVFLIGYYAESRLSRPLFRLLHSFDRGRIEQFLNQQAAELRDSII
jgi:hypothetical protein